MNPQDYLQKYQDTSNQLNNIIESSKTEKTQGEQALKQQLGYEDKQKNLDSITSQFYETQKRLDALPEAVQQRTAGRNVTQAQLDRIIGSEADPLSKQAKNMAMSQEEARGNLSRVEQALRDYVTNFNADLNTKLNLTTEQAKNFLQMYDRTYNEERARIQDQQVAEEIAWQKELQDREDAYRQQQLALQQQQLALTKAQQDRANAQAREDMTFTLIRNARDNIETMLYERGMSPSDPNWNKLVNDYVSNYLKQNMPLYNTMDVNQKAIQDYINQLNSLSTGTSTNSTNAPGVSLSTVKKLQNQK